MHERKLQFICILSVMCVPIAANSAIAITIQTSNMVFDSRPFLWVEAEDFASRGPDPENDGWRLVDAVNPVSSTQGLDILTADSNVSGSALIDWPGGDPHEDTVQYEVRFQTAGTYQLYTRHTLYDFNGDSRYGNEDSVFFSPAFNLDSADDWVGFQGLDWDQDDPTIDPFQVGVELDPDGFKPDVGNHPNDGNYQLYFWGIKSDGELFGPLQDQDAQYDGHFNWYSLPTFVEAAADGSTGRSTGIKVEYTVTPEMVGQTLTFEMGNREPYGVFDGFLFIQDDNRDLLDDISQSELDAVLTIPEPATGLACAVLACLLTPARLRRAAGV